MFSLLNPSDAATASALAVFIAAYTAVLVSELIGDKSFYTVAALSSRYAPIAIWSGMTLACMGKMFFAVMFGKVIALLPEIAVTTMTVTTFLLAALLMALRNPRTEAAETLHRYNWGRGAVVSFGSLFFVEWGDIGQVTAAYLSARYNAPALIWFAGTLALLTKNSVALGVGLGLRKYVAGHLFQRAAIGVFLLLAVLAAFHID